MSGARLGVFEVFVDRSDVAAFREAARLEGETLPFTYPIRWLALPQVRQAIMTLLPEPDLVPFHESQTFDYRHPLQSGVGYTLAVAGHRESAPDRLLLEASVSDATGALHATIATVLRLVPTGQAA